jgi:hypothetical protein
VKADDRIGKSDCWTEVRATLKSPSGFLKRSAGSVSRRVTGTISTSDSYEIK